MEGGEGEEGKKEEEAQYKEDEEVGKMSNEPLLLRQSKSASTQQQILGKD